MNNEVLNVDWNNITLHQRRVLLEEISAYSKSVQNFQQFHYTHLADMRSLVSFLIIAAWGAFFDVKIETVVALWFVPHFVLTVMSKVAQYGSSLEMTRRLESLQKAVASVRQSGEDDQ